MLTVNIICVGKLKENYLKAAELEYKKRLTAYCKLNIIEISEYRLPDIPSDALIKKGLSYEEKEIFKKCRGFKISMCIEGNELSSPALAKKINEITLNGESEFTFIIGCSFGLSNNVKEKSSLKLSMSLMTFPHHLARVMLLEQLYRTFSINTKSKYHK